MSCQNVMDWILFHNCCLQNWCHWTICDYFIIDNTYTHSRFKINSLKWITSILQFSPNERVHNWPFFRMYDIFLLFHIYWLSYFFICLRTTSQKFLYNQFQYQFNCELDSSSYVSSETTLFIKLDLVLFAV